MNRYIGKSVTLRWVLVLSAFLLLLSITPASAMAQENALRVGMECAYAPYNWSQKTDENGAVPIKGSDEYANGYDVMIAKQIAQALGRELEIDKIEWDGLILSINAGKIDAAVAGMSITENRKLSVDFSDVYYQAYIVALVRKDSAYASAVKLDELAGAQATAQLNTIWYDMIGQIPEVKKQPALDSLPTMIVALTSGKVDVVVCDVPSALAAQASNGDLIMLELKDSPFVASAEQTDCGIAVKKGNSALTEQINAVLAQISPEEREEMMRTAISIQPLAQ